ncbi:type I DNA topoisomerase [Micavibrio aeruginosavorus]|uniref:DNA topoisomerase 1 n=1 Tax=Micavibrio aeruginosavorus (strain ARL-13) TaxID=856793 RepID=G2KNL1_MICAA|nr:type I DNA topoisomerase [Micavibrio aeruginosavorus]AEP10256.1 DNA topoisomerase I [Micavibrio aeruginosavorus ARL-13]
MSASNLVIVESPSKAKTINKYLGPDYEVLASYGHVRDLPPKDGSVDPENGFAMLWELGDRAAKPVNDIRRAVKKAKALYLATDPDREGEAISWHVQELLKDEKLLEGKQVFRVTFNEITKKAVQEAFKNARDLDAPLVEAYLARRALDYLVGFNLSPVLWRKLPGSRSAGRVQSVALRLICERESEIEKFRADEYWTIEARLHNRDGAPFTARLTHLSGNKLDKLDIGSEAQATAAANRIRGKNLVVQNVEKKQVRRFPPAPFITSTLQQEASRKLGFGASQTMRLAQRLYEGTEINGDTVGLITYMRTDGTTLSEDAVTQCRDVIKSNYGPKYLPDAPRLYKSKAKNAQEAHEAIRPTDLSRTPDEVRMYVDDQMARLYELIWKRTMASQMENAVMDQVGADISDGTTDVVLRATGSTVAFDGFLTLYQEGQDDDETDEENRRLPVLDKGDATKLIDVAQDQHFTQPPPRYSEASLVKKMEELGIGRPSTYASILQVLQDRDYVRLDKKRFIPEDRGRLVTTFLSKFFTRYVDYDFTATLEEELDAIAAGQAHWKDALAQFWKDFSKAVGDTKNLTITEVIDNLDAELGPHFFPVVEHGKDPRICPACNEGRLSLKLGKFGAFIGCANYPDCRYTRPLVVPSADENAEGGEAGGESGLAAQLANAPKILGHDPVTGRAVSLRRGPYGPYVQIDPPEAPPAPAVEEKAPEVEDGTAKKGKGKAKKKKETAEKPKRQGVPKGLKLEDIDLAAALKLLELPREVGLHPETKEMIKAGIGRFGPFLVHQGSYTSIPKGDDVLTIGINRAVDLIAAKAERAANGGGRRGGWGKKKAKADGDDAAPKKTAAKKKAPDKKAAAKKPAAKKTAAKKPAAKKTATKKPAAKE